MDSSSEAVELVQFLRGDHWAHNLLISVSRIQFLLNNDEFVQFIGTSVANGRADEACALGVRDLWTPDNHYRWNESRYGGHISASVNPVHECRLFSQSKSFKKTSLRLRWFIFFNLNCLLVSLVQRLRQVMVPQL